MTECSITLHRVTLADGSAKRSGWLVFSGQALCGIIIAYDHKYLLHSTYICEISVRSGPPLFNKFEDAVEWLEKKLGSGEGPPGS